MHTSKSTTRLSRKKRIRAKVIGTSARPRLTVYRSLKAVYAQVIDDASGKTLAAASTTEAKAKANVEGAKKVGEMLAKKAKDAGINTVVFDRNAYKFHGAVKALAEAAREGGLQF
jgi:large subunit ribosomal protein L18